MHDRRVRTGLVLAATTLSAAATLAAATLSLKLADLPDIDQASLLAHTKMLASDAFEGRLPGTKGEDTTVAYLEEQFRKMGLKPGNTDGTYVQKVPLVGVTPKPTADLAFSTSAKTDRLVWRDDYVGWTSRVVDTTALTNSELVFVGYGVEAPEFAWDDYKGIDLTGKTMVVLVGDPPVADPSDPAKLDPKTFGGRAMTYYGRWTYKYEMGAARKAAGVIIVHETGPAGYGWGVVRGFADERFGLRMPDGNSGRTAFEGWITLEQTRKLFASAGKDFDALKKAAVARDFKPVPLGVTASVAIANTLRNVDSRNVAALLPGREKPDELVIYTAHWDHFGIGEPVNGDRIYNGAVDNASGTAGLLEVARAFTRLSQAPKRSVLFLAVTAEEQGLRGSEYYAEHPIYPLEKTLANINIDGLGVHGRTRDLVVIGLGASDLDDYAREAAAEQGRTLAPDAEPEKGSYYRSDHFPMAKQGVPAFYTDEGVDFIGKPKDFAQKMRDSYLANRYHKPQDEVQPTWDLSGAAEDLKLLVAVGLRVAEADRYPEWKPGTEFRARREAQLKKTDGEF